MPAYPGRNRTGQAVGVAVPGLSQVWPRVSPPRLVVFPLCLYVVATGCGTIYPRMPARGWLVLLLVFGGFAASLGCIIPNSDPSVRINLAAARVGAVLMYAAVYLTVLAETVVSCKVLKAQLLMIRQQRIDPRSCPAWAKFRLFTGLRHYVCAYLTLEALLIVLQMLQLPWVWDRLATLFWELMQLCIAAALGWVFGGTSFNRFVESERHMLPGEMVTTALLASEMSLTWQARRPACAAPAHATACVGGAGTCVCWVPSKAAPLGVAALCPHTRPHNLCTPPGRRTTAKSLLSGKKAPPCRRHQRPRPSSMRLAAPPTRPPSVAPAPRGAYRPSRARRRRARRGAGSPPLPSWSLHPWRAAARQLPSLRPRRTSGA